MTLQLIGAGFGRTGTLSLKVAIEKLGLGPCYHMMEVLGNPEHVPLWRRAADGDLDDWESIFASYPATVDWPASRFWRELADAYPEARVLLSLRDPDRWYDSVRSTIYEAMTRPLPPDAPELLRDQRAMARRIVLEETFENRFEDRDFAIGVFERHNREVIDAIAPDRLLVYEAREGWEPLCRWLGRPVPDEPFPRLNDGAAFRERIGLPEP